MVDFCVRNTFVYKFANFARLYFPQFTTFRDQTWQCNYFQHAHSSCGKIFCSSCLDQNLVYNANCPLNALEKSIVQFRVREHQEYPSLLAVCVAYMFEQVIER